MSTNEIEEIKDGNVIVNKGLSKNQIKKLAKQAHWQNIKKQKRQEEKQKKKLKRQRALEEGRTLGPSRKMIKQMKMCDSPCKIRIAVDMSLDDLMTDRELSKCIKQINRCYYLNRRLEAPTQFYITSFANKVKELMSVNGTQNWDVNLCEKNYLDEFNIEEIVYLTSESDNVVDELDPTKIYIIGGLVDHNRLKGYCHKKAIENKIAHARLPLDINLIMKTRKVLTVDQVFNIILKRTEGESWSESMINVIPKRKGAMVKKDEEDSCDSEDEKTNLDNNESEETGSEKQDKTSNSKSS